MADTLDPSTQEKGFFSKIENPSFELTLETISKAKWGVDVRDAIAQGLRFVYNDDDTAQDDLLASFKKEFSSIESKTDNLAENLKRLDRDWADKLKRVTLGVDEETIKQVVEKILEERGVI